MEPQKMEKWGTKLTIKFLKKYREHRCLWDFNDPEYKNRIARTNALEDICEAMAINNFDVRSANVKIKALRSTYLHEKRKIRKSGKTGVSYRPKLAWYPLADSFLRNYVMEKFCLMGAMSNENDGGQSQQQQQQQQQQQGQINEMTKLNEDNIQNDKQNFTEPQSLSSITAGIGTGTNQQRSKQNNSANLKMTRSQIQQHHQQQQQQQSFNIGHGHGQSQTQIIPLGSMLPSIQPMTNNNNNNNNNKEKHSSSQHHLHHNDGITNFNDVAENCHQNLITYPHPSSASSLVHNRHKDFDEFDAFGNSIAAQMRTLPLDIAYEVQLQIQCLITQTKLKVLGRQTSIIVESNNNNNNNNNNNSNNSNNNIPSSSSSSARNWNQTSNNMNNPNVNNYSHSNACNQDVKMEGDDDGNNIDIDNNHHHQHQHTNNTLENHHNHHNQHQIQNNDTSNTNCFGNIPSDGLQDPETSDVEDYLGLE